MSITPEDRSQASLTETMKRPPIAQTAGAESQEQASLTA